MVSRIVKADKRYRRKAIIAYVLITLVCIAAIKWGLPEAEDYLHGIDARSALDILKFTLILIFLSVVPMALYLMTFGWKVLKSERWPPPGVKVIRDVCFIEGSAAKVRGRVLIAFSIILIALGLFGALFTPVALSKFEKTRFNHATPSSKYLSIPSD